VKIVLRNIESDFLMICVNILGNMSSFVTKFGCSDVKTIRTLVFHVSTSCWSFKLVSDAMLMLTC
jgi:Uri superfamily endonuclease